MVKGIKSITLLSQIRYRVGIVNFTGLLQFQLHWESYFFQQSVFYVLAFRIKAFVHQI